MNSRTYHRNSRLAFKDHCDYACAVEIPVGHRSLLWHLWRFLKGLL
jgi:hypothetical protein